MRRFIHLSSSVFAFLGFIVLAGAEIGDREPWQLLKFAVVWAIAVGLALATGPTGNNP